MKHIDIAVFGLSVTSSWGNGHATTYRSLLKALAARGHRITFFEKDVPWYAAHRDLPDPAFCRTVLYHNFEELEDYMEALAAMDLIIIGSYVQDARQLAARIGRLAPPCFAFYDIDTPVTLAKLAKGDYEYLHPAMIPAFDVYLSFSGGPILRKLEQEYGAQRARPLYCSVDPELYYPLPEAAITMERYALGYLGTYSNDRQPTVDELLIGAARLSPDEMFCVAGPQYPADIEWPDNVQLIDHLPPSQHCEFYNAQRFTLNVTRRDMISAGYSPSVRLFEAAACGTPIISDYWTGLDSLFEIDREVLIAGDRQSVYRYLQLPETQRRELGDRARQRALTAHTSAHRAQELENYWQEVTESLVAVDH